MLTNPAPNSPAPGTPDPGTSDIRITRRDGVAIVTLDRPDRRNAMTLAMWQGLGRIFPAFSADPAVRAVVLTGAGGHFTAGADISEFATLRDDAAQAVAYEQAVDSGCDAIAACAKPVIAACAGFTLGGGAHVAMSCDFRFAHPDAQFGIPAARLSIVYGVRGTTKLLALVGLTEAKRILFGAERFGAEHALRTGFVDGVCDDPLAEALAYAASLAGNAPLSQAGAKYILNGLALGGFDAGQADRLIDGAAASDDYREGRAAFAEKRAPRFQGR